MLKKSFSNYCAGIGGITEGSACKKQAGTDQVLYFAKIAHTGKRGSGYHQVGLDVISPNASLSSSSYVSALKKYGYSTISDGRRDQIIQARVKEINNYRRNAIAVSLIEKNKRELPFKQQTGAKICKNVNGVSYIGYVERVASPKVQIRISQARMVGSSYLSPAGFKPSIIWDYASAWTLCN